ncbi:MAG TPA: hypothetical protein VGB67_01580 [Fibrella sp.]|jgi:predicted nucleic acid-binding Zn ribbon protein
MWKNPNPKPQLPTITNPDRVCVICSKEYKAVSPLQKTCSKDCRDINNAPRHQRFKEKHPEAMKVYNANRVTKDPLIWRRKLETDRIKILQELGGKCIVCGVTNKNWLHVDYIPTMVGTGMRHPRHLKWVLEHKEDFRILCANHHYELTITGKIEGTNITQERRPIKSEKNEYSTK